MGALTADDLLVGPRGRMLCMAVAHRLDFRVWSAWHEASWHLDDDRPRAALVHALRAVDAERVAGWRDPAAFVESVEETVGHAMYWQPAHNEDLIAAGPDVVTALRPLAAAIAAAPAAAWWSTGPDLSSLRVTSWSAETAPPLTGASDRLRGWRQHTVADDLDAARHRPADLTAPWSGNWWSTPAVTSLATTTRPLPGLGSAELVWQEDSMGRQDAAIWQVEPIGPARVYEIHRPDAWARLVERFPLDVTHARRHDWYRTTGRTGTWRIPDWSAVAAEWDGVYVSVAGYLTTATRALPLADGAGTMLAGWNPDRTWWLTDILRTTMPSPERWQSTQDPPDSNPTWRPVRGDG